MHVQWLYTCVHKEQNVLFFFDFQPLLLLVAIVTRWGWFSSFCVVDGVTRGRHLSGDGWMESPQIEDERGGGGQSQDVMTRALRQQACVYLYNAGVTRGEAVLEYGGGGGEM